MSNKNELAELKPVKFCEPQPGNAEGNAEPTSEIEKCEETRRQVCIKCGSEISPDGEYHSKKYCGKKCAKAYFSQQYKIRNNLIQKPGVGSGNNQGLHETHATWKDGIGTYKQIAFEHYPKICNRCGSDENICVHHKDENQHNNVIENLEVLCKKCHQAHHTKRDPVTGQYIKA